MALKSEGFICKSPNSLLLHFQVFKALLNTATKDVLRISIHMINNTKQEAFPVIFFKM